MLAGFHHAAQGDGVKLQVVGRLREGHDFGLLCHGAALLDLSDPQFVVAGLSLERGLVMAESLPNREIRYGY